MDQVLLVEDDVATRDWLAGLLSGEGGVQVAHACGTVAEALAWLHAGHRVDIVLTDLGLPDGSGLQVIRAASRRANCDVLVLSIFGDESNVLAAIDAGASGYLLKDGSLDSIREHLDCLKSGGSPLSPRIARTLIRRTRAQEAALAAERVVPDGTAEPLLSERERDVLTGIGKGFSYAEVAEALKITTNTVRTHVRHLYEKLAVNSRAEALYEYNRRMVEQGQTPIR
ncbi:MAG: response regulator transcription factor [Ideonella sp.]|jgi:DNA-binding NarL/FixJ family response regulator|nr:response regulator transcription factor [Ideonella sp.]MBL0150406.1 response regulator transcription factor [Ideonella sp.]